MRPLRVDICLHLNGIFIPMLILMLVFWHAPAVRADDAKEADTAAGILQGASIFGGAAHLEIECHMTITSSQGNKERTVKAYLSREEGVSKILLHIIAPGFLNRMKFLTHLYEDGREYKWMRTSRGTTRLSGADRNQKVFDSDFTVEDFSELALADFRLSLLPDSEIDGVLCRVVEAVPEDALREYHRKILYIDPKDRLIRSIEYQDAGGLSVRRYRVIQTQDVGGRSAPLICRMSTPGDGTETLLEFTETLTPESIPDRLFNKASL